MWLAKVETTTGTKIDVDWQPFSLTQVNSDKDAEIKSWDQPGVLDGSDKSFLAHQSGLAAKRQGVSTQMGNQHPSGGGYRTLVKVIQSGAIGKVKEAHTWSDRPIWPQGIGRPAGADPVPKTVDWNLWLGVARRRPYTMGPNPED